MFNLVLRGQISVVKENEFKGEKTIKIQMFNVGEKNIDVINVKMLKTEKFEDIKKDVNCEIEVKLFTPEDKKEIYFSQISPIKYVK